MPPYQYTVKSGDTLNKIVQGMGFSDYKAAGITSVPSGNFDLVREGEVINIPGKQSVQQTTTGMRTQAAVNSSKLDAELARLGISGLAKGSQDEGQKTVSVVRDLDNGDGTRTVTYSDGITARVQATKNQDGTESYKELSPSEGVEYDESRDIGLAEESAQKRVQYANQTLDSIQGRLGIATDALIESIKATYGARIQEMKDTNKRILQTKKQAGYRSGRAKYVSGVQAGILTDEEQAGIARVSDLEGKMLTLIAEAEQARSDKDLEVFNIRMKELNSASDDLRTAVQDIHKRAGDELKRIQDASKAQADKEKADFEMQLDRSERAAPALSDAIARLNTPEEQYALLAAYAEKTGVEPDILLGDIEEYTSANEKKNLDIENIRNQIANRNASTAIASERLALDKKKAEFSPTADQKAKVGKYLAKNGTDEDTAKAQDDPDFFYFILGKAEDEEI